MIEYKIYVKGSKDVFTHLETETPLIVGEKLFLLQTEHRTYRIIEIENRCTFIEGIHVAYEKIAVVVKCKPAGT